MAYQPTKPLANDKLSTSQGDISGNFTEINTFVGVDHVLFNSADQGKHNRVFFKQQVPNQVAPLPVTDAAGDCVTGATEAALYTKDSTGAPGTAGLYFRPPNSGAPIEFTYALKATPGWCILPSGIIMKWGSGNFPGGGNITMNVAFPVAATIPVFAAAPVVTMTPCTSGGAGDHYPIFLSGAPTTLGFNVYGDTSARAFYYLAIGY